MDACFMNVTWTRVRGGDATWTCSIFCTERGPKRKYSFSVTSIVCWHRALPPSLKSSQTPNLHKIPILIDASSVHQLTSWMVCPSLPSASLLFLPPLLSDRLEAFPLVLHNIAQVAPPFSITLSASSSPDSRAGTRPASAHSVLSDAASREIRMEDRGGLEWYSEQKKDGRIECSGLLDSKSGDKHLSFCLRPANPSVQDYRLLLNVGTEGERIASAAVTLRTCGDFRKNMSGLGWCLSIILSWAKFLFFCILPFGKHRKSKVELCWRNLNRSVCRSGPACFLFVSWSLVNLNEPEWLWLVVLWESKKKKSAALVQLSTVLVLLFWPAWFICYLDQTKICCLCTRPWFTRNQYFDLWPFFP